jgi:hypothetical protein
VAGQSATMRRVPSRPGGNDTQKNSCPDGDGAGAGAPGHAGDLGAGLAVPATWRALLDELAPAFRRRSTHALFMALACGMILAGRRTVVAMAAAAGMAGRFRRACWFFSHAVWDVDDLGVALAEAREILKLAAHFRRLRGRRRTRRDPAGEVEAAAKLTARDVRFGGHNAQRPDAPPSYRCALLAVWRERARTLRP